MRRLVLATSVLSALTSAACLDNPSAPSPIDRQVSLTVGETASLASDVVVRFVSVPNDSRCPGDATCISAGDAIVRIEVAADGSRGERELHTIRPDGVTHGGVNVELLTLEPYPFASRPIAPGDYRATLRVRR